MHVKSLKVFCDVVGQRSFSRAADENGISQSGASQMVHHLEEELGVKLIDRSKRPFVLTAEGEVFYEGCKEIVQRLYALDEEVRTLHDEVAGRVQVASIYSVGLSHMNAFVQQFLARYPKANVRLEYEHPSEVYEMVANDLADLGLVSFPKSTRTVKATPWRDEPMVLVCAPTHRLAAQSSVQLKDLDGLKLISFDRNLQIRRETDRELAAHDVDVEIVMELDNIETIKRAIEIDAGVSLLPEPTVTRELQLGSLSIATLSDTCFSRPLGIIERRGKELGRTARRFKQLLLEYPDCPPDAFANRSSESNTPARTTDQAAAERIGASHSNGGDGSSTEDSTHSDQSRPKRLAK